MYDDPEVIIFDCTSSQKSIKDISMTINSCVGCGKKTSNSMMKESFSDPGRYCNTCFIQTKYDWIVDENKDHVIRDKSSGSVICTLVDFPLCRGEFGFIIKNAPSSFYKNLIAKRNLNKILEENDIKKIKDLIVSTLEDLNN